VDLQQRLLDHLAQLGLASETVGHAAVHLLVEDRRAPAAPALGSVHGEVGGADQVGRAHPVGAQRDPDRDPDAQVAALDAERLLHRAQDPLGDHRRLGRLGEPLQQHRELVAAQARDGVAGAQRAGDPLGEGDEQLVADGVAEAVVDLLELVEVEEQQRAAVLRLAAGTPQRLLDAVNEQRPVGQPGEGVVQRLVLQPLLLDVAVGRVRQGAGHADRRAVDVARGHALGHHPAPGPVAVAHAELALQARRLARQVGLDLVAQPHHVVGGDEREPLVGRDLAPLLGQPEDHVPAR
jgi:hypothetical protein